MYPLPSRLLSSLLHNSIPYLGINIPVLLSQTSANLLTQCSHGTQWAQTKVFPNGPEDKELDQGYARRADVSQSCPGHRRRRPHCCYERIRAGRMGCYRDRKLLFTCHPATQPVNRCHSVPLSFSTASTASSTMFGQQELGPPARLRVISSSPVSLTSVFYLCTRTAPS